MDFYILVSAHAAKLHERWRPVLQWVVQNAIARINGKSGWGRGNPDPDSFYVGAPHEANAQSWYGSWAEAWAKNTGGDPVSAAASTLAMEAPPSGSGDYINGMRGALAAASQVLGLTDPLLAEVQGCLDYLTPYHQSWCRNGYGCEYKWSQQRYPVAT